MFCRHRRQGGFTLLEVLLAAGILAVGLLGVAALQVAALRGSQGTRTRMVAVGLAGNALERALGEARAPAPALRTFTDPGTAAWEDRYGYGGQPCKGEPPFFTVRVTRTEVPPGGCWRFEARVTWPEVGAAPLALGRLVAF